MDEKIHAFEDAGLGKGPYSFVTLVCFVAASVAEHNPTGYTNGNAMAVATLKAHGVNGGFCQLCGMPLMNNYIVKGSERTFVVGSECVAKCGDDNLVRQVSRAERDHANQVRHEREARTIEDGKAWFDTVRPYFDTVIVETPYRRQTFSEGFDWYMAHAGNAGKLSMIKAAHKRHAEEVKV